MTVGVAVSSFLYSRSLLKASSLRHKFWLWIPWVVICGSRRSVSAFTSQAPILRTANTFVPYPPMVGQKSSVRRLAAVASADEGDKVQKPAKKSKSANQEEPAVAEEKKKKTAKKGKSTKPVKGSAANVESKKEPTSKKRSKKKDSTVSKAKKEDGSASPSPKKKAKKADHQRLTERDELPKLWNDEKAKANGSYTFKIMSWNVAGLRALMRNHPDALSDLAKTHDIDVICLQETKLQETHVTDPKLKLKGHLLEDEGYESHYSCSTARKGYAGTAVFVKKHGNKEKQAKIGNFFGKKDAPDENTEKESDAVDFDAALLTPENVSFELGKEEHDAEGRIIALDFPLFSFANLYVPNSGQKLDRLGYRTENWDIDVLKYMQNKQKERNVPVMWLGDLNVAHTAMEVWNDGAKHLAKSAGTTPEERASFQRQLDAGFIDVFRHLHPTAKGQYTYWSQRAGNREPNKGLRLDYFVCSPSFLDESSKAVIRDCYMLPNQLGSDHCPIVIEIEVKK